MRTYPVWVGMWLLITYVLYRGMHATLPGLDRPATLLEIVGGIVVTVIFGAMLGLLLTH